MAIEFKKGLVTTNKDPSQTGVIHAIIYGQHYFYDEFGNIVSNGSPATKGDPIDLTNVQGVPIVYTSPYYDNHLGGMIAIPNPGSEIFILFDQDLNEYFYVSTIVGKKRLFGNNLSKTPTKVIPEKYIYTNQALPKAITYMDHKGAGLKVSNYYSRDEEGQVMGPHVQLKTAMGHKVFMSDVPDKLDCVIVRDRSGDGITITDSAKSSPLPANSIYSKSRGPQWNIVGESDYWIWVVDGTEVDIENWSTGAKADTTERQTGNVSLRSLHRDINLNTYVNYGDDGNIFIKTERKVPHTPEFSGSVVQINAGGEVRIYSASGISIKSEGNFNLSVDGNINIEGENVNIRARNDINMLADQKFKAQGDAATAIGAGDSRLDLNHPQGSGANPEPPNVPAPLTNGYFE